MPTSIKNIIIFLAACILFIPFLGQVHLFDWDEINFAECAREMIVSKDYIRAQIDFNPFWEKPPVFIWMQVLAMKLFGVGDFAARFPNAVMGIATLMTLFYAGRKVANEKVATWWVVLYAASWLPHFYFKSGIIDPTFNFFIFLGFFQFHLIRFANNKFLHTLLTGLFIGIAVLTKGPVAILVSVLSLGVYIILNKGLYPYKPAQLLLIALCAIIPFAAWMGIAALVNGNSYAAWFLNEFITYQIRLFRTEDADHGGPFVYHFIVLLIGCFPASAFLFQYSRKRSNDATHTKDFTKWMWIMFWVVLILFSIVKTKIVHYSSLCYFPLTYLAAVQLYRLSETGETIKKSVKIILWVSGGLFALLITLLPVVGLNKEKIIPLIDDPFAVGNLQAAVSWSYAECLLGLAYLLAVIICVYYLQRNFKKGIIALTIVQVVMIQITVLHITPKIEAYSQRAAIDFYKSFEGKNVYIIPLGYKSYANIYYAKKQPFAAKDYFKDGKINEGWLLDGPIDKDAYFVSKIQNSAQYDTLPQLQRLYAKNGFVFYKRTSASK